MASTDSHRASHSFLDHFTQFIRVDFSCKQIDQDSPHEFAEELQIQLLTLCKSIATTSEDDLHLVVWPGIFTTSKADAIVSRDAHQDRGSFLIGIYDATNVDHIRSVLSLWEKDIRASIFFIDYIPVPLLAAYIVQQAELGRLVKDSWTWPQPIESEPRIYSTDTTSAETLEDMMAFVPSPSTITQSEAGTPAAAAAGISKRFPSPGSKKFTPATAILNRLKWDGAFSSADFIVVYEDRHDGMMESPIDMWTTESTEEHFIPMHRIRAIKRRDTGMVVWHREERIDFISGART